VGRRSLRLHGCAALCLRLGLWLARYREDLGHLTCAYCIFLGETQSARNCAQVFRSCLSKILVTSCGVSSKGFADWAASDGRVQHDQQQVAIFTKGIYGVPGYICEGAYYFGREHLPHLGQIIAGKPAGSLDVGYSLPAPAQLEALDDGKHRVFLELLGAARSNSLEIIAGVNSDCVQTHLALKTLEEIQRAFPQRLSIRYGQVAGQALANSSASEVAEPDHDAVGTIENRGDAHRSFRSRYELMDARR